MNIKNVLLLVLVGLLFVLGCSKDQENLIPDFPPPTGDFQTDILAVVNAYRQQGCRCGSTRMPKVPPLQWDELLENAAQRHAQDMEIHNFIGHTGSDNSSMGQRVLAAGYNWIAVAENVAYGYQEIIPLVIDWMGSESHCLNIMNEEFKDMGVARQGNYWAQDLGALKD